MQLVDYSGATVMSAGNASSSSEFVAAGADARTSARRMIKWKAFVDPCAGVRDYAVSIRHPDATEPAWERIVNSSVEATTYQV